MIDSGESATTSASGMSSSQHEIELYVPADVVAAGFPVGALAKKVDVEGLGVRVVCGVESDVGNGVDTPVTSTELIVI